MVELTEEEAREVLRHAMTARGVNWDAMPPETRLQAMGGAIVIVTALQELGWRVARPMKAM